MAKFKTGVKRLPGAGRKKGTPNKITRTVKETVLTVFNEIQSDRKVNLKAFAKKHPKEFYQLAARLIPTELTGANGKDLINFKELQFLSETQLDDLIKALEKKAKA